MHDALKDLLQNNEFKKNVKLTPKFYAANDIILNENSLHTQFYIVATGSVRVMLSGKVEEKPIHLGILDVGPGEIFGEFCLFDEGPSSAQVIAVEATELIEIDKNTFLKFLENYPQIGYTVLFSFLRIVVTRLRHSNKSVISLFASLLKKLKLDPYL